MEHGPVPPHERSWRHPSELAAAEQAVIRAEPVSHSTRTVALTTGTVGLLAIALLVLTMTPSRDGAPVALSASTTLATAAFGDGSGPTIAAIRRTSTADTAPTVGAPTGYAIATPIGQGRYAVVSRASLAGLGGTTLSVVLPSGRLASGQLIETSSDAVLVALDESEPGHAVAERRPHDREVVTVMSSPPVTIAFADIAALEVAEGTAVLDDHGELVGLCSRRDHGTTVIEIDGAMADDDSIDALVGQLAGKAQPADEPADEQVDQPDDESGYVATVTTTIGGVGGGTGVPTDTTEVDDDTADIDHDDSDDSDDASTTTTTTTEGSGDASGDGSDDESGSDEQSGGSPVDTSADADQGDAAPPNR